MKLHLCLVSEQTLANLIPALMEHPDRVVLVVSPEMAARRLDHRLKTLLEKEDIQVEIHGNAPDTGLAAIHEFALNLAAKLQASFPKAEIILNATGGTKLMALGFVEVFRGIARRILYTDTAHRRIEALPEGKRVPDPIPMTDVLDVPKYLAAQGLGYLKAASDDPQRLVRIAQRKVAAKYLAKNAAQLNRFFGKLNFLADRAFAGTNELVAQRQSFDSAPRPGSSWANALKCLNDARLLEWKEGTAEITFLDAERAQFLHGGWLEEYAFHVLRDKKAFDVRLGAEVANDAGGRARNEFDVLATHGNRLLFIECKTLRFNPNENDSELAYKLDSLGKAARGLFGETWLLSARPPTPLLEERLRTLRIRLIAPGELPHLRKAVQAWMMAR